MAPILLGLPNLRQNIRDQYFARRPKNLGETVDTEASNVLTPFSCASLLLRAPRITAQGQADWHAGHNHIQR